MEGKPKGIKLNRPSKIILGPSKEKIENLSPDYRDHIFTDNYRLYLINLLKNDLGNTNPRIARINLRRAKKEMRKIEEEVATTNLNPSPSQNRTYAGLAVQVKYLEEIVGENKIKLIK